MALTSPQFIFFFVLVALAFNLTRVSQYRIWILTIANAIFLASFVPEPRALAPLAAFLAVGYLAFRLSRPGRALVNGTLLALIVLMFVYLKKYAFLGPVPSLPFPYLSIGLSYILFRMLQLVIDRSYGEDTRHWTVHEFFDFTCNFLCFISGPIQRSSQFLEDQGRVSREIDSDLAYRAFRRLLNGYIKVVVISALANFLFDGVSAKLFALNETASLTHVVPLYAVAVAAYTTYLYYNFSGYMDIVIGVGWLLGQDLPENFDHPFRARNLFEFWARWHMTLSEWFKTYLFNPLLGALASRFGTARAMPALGVIAFFVTFFVMGVWHGSTLVFVIYGLVMGAGVSVDKVWQLWLIARLGKKGARAVSANSIYRAAASGITISFFAIAVTALWVDWGQLHQLTVSVGLSGLISTFLLLAVIASVIFPLTEWLVLKGSIIQARWLELVNAPAARQALLGASVIFIVAVNSFFHKAPEFVYKAF
jgi:D-alanyl-lipoteichoic acid acyltransferase DltB (MBOAT superfamily)